MLSISGCPVCGPPCLSVQLRHGAVWQGELGSFFFLCLCSFYEWAVCVLSIKVLWIHIPYTEQNSHIAFAPQIWILFFATEEPAWHFDFQAEQLYLRSIKIGRQLFGPSYSGLEYDYRGLIQVFNSFGPLNLIVVIELWGLYLLWGQSSKSKNPLWPSNEWNSGNTPTVIFFTLGNCIEIDSDGGTFWIGSLPCIQRTSAVRATDPEWELFLRAWEDVVIKDNLIMLQYWLDRCRFTRWRPTLRGLSSSTGCCRSGRCWGTRRMLSRLYKFSHCLFLEILNSRTSKLANKKRFIIPPIS